MTHPFPASARVTVDLGALVANWRDLDARARPGRAGAVVKADAYGLGADFVATALHKAGCRTFFVAFPEEGMALKHYVGDAEIFVFSALAGDGLAMCRSRGLIPVLNSTIETGWWPEHGQGQPAALMLDTGINRLGLNETEALICAGRFHPRLLMTHLACADEPAHEMNRRQRESFQKLRAVFGDVESSLANSAGLFLGPEYASDIARPGIALYGGAPTIGVPNPMRPVATLEARVTHVHRAVAGETVSYGATQRLMRDTLIATAAIGYADGLPRALSGTGVALRTTEIPGGHGFVTGHNVPILGRVTMDATMFDVTALGVDGIRPGDWIELFGPNIAVDDAAASAGTVAYELLTGLGKRIERRYTIGS